MPRRGSSGGRSSGRSGGGGFFGGRKSAPTRTRTAPKRTAPPPAKVESKAPAATQQSAPPATAPSSGGGMLSGIGSTIMQGMAFGTGSAIANRAVDSVMGPRTMQVEHVGQDGEPMSRGSNSQSSGGQCGDEMGSFNQCMKDQGNDVNACKMYFDLLSQCQTDANF
jgi:hypothetical protein